MTKSEAAVQPTFCRAHCAAWSDGREAKMPGTGCGYKIFNQGCMWTEEQRQEAQKGKK